MAPVTRSASKRHQQAPSTKASRALKGTIAGPSRNKAPGTRRNNSQEAKAATASPPMPSPNASPPEYVPEVDESAGAVIEWCSIEGSEFKDNEKLVGWIDILIEIRRLPGCSKVVQEDHAKLPFVFAIEWKDGKARRQYLESEASRRFTQAFEKDQVRRQFLMRPPYSRAPPSLLNHSILREVFTAYFPTDLSKATVEALKWVMPHTIGYGAQDSGPQKMHPLDHPYEGLLDGTSGWADGIVEYQKQPARRLIYIFEWLDELAQQRFRQELAIKRPGRTPTKIMEVFVADLEEMGMLGIENRNIHFLDVRGY
ncbi:hypothetical protein HYFRA_00013441 [Hymenoscyphus fraxineus]|uniref:Uncharacterized protein n=1 Tax=Hymenoscyphus fraxineus TaxID=746836 RepID=A0A9N9LA03_9HELO|nr:hypothetical protein HYFRA_00013441 [Hymenoscyphus fraxineus]